MYTISLWHCDVTSIWPGLTPQTVRQAEVLSLLQYRHQCKSQSVINCTDRRRGLPIRWIELLHFKPNCPRSHYRSRIFQYFFEKRQDIAIKPVVSHWYYNWQTQINYMGRRRFSQGISTTRGTIYRKIRWIDPFRSYEWYVYAFHNLPNTIHSSFNCSKAVITGKS